MNNSLKEKFPEIAKEWDYSKNGDITPENVSYGSAKKYWWICPNNHSYEASINHRTNEFSKTNCPYCANQKVLKGYNDLLSNNPKLCEEWNYEKNDLNPNEVTTFSNKKVWWICNKQHEWKTSIFHRIEGTNCPECQKNKKTSFNELSIYFYIKKYFPDTISTFKEKGFEIDIYIPSKKIGIEYDSFYFHKDKEKDLKKNQLCVLNNITLYRIREKNCPILNSSSIDYILKDDKKETLNETIYLLLKSLNLKNVSKESINILENYNDILNIIDYKDSMNSIFNKSPDLLKEWNYEKNTKINPKNISFRSNKKVWWICSNQHEWETTPNNRVEGYNCPYCNNLKVLEGFNDLKTHRPELLCYWDYTKNNIKPTEIFPYSSKKVWWIHTIDKEGKEFTHSWQKEPNGIKELPTCPYCNNRKILEGFNDLKTHNPDIILFWDYEKNEKEPNNYVFSTHEKVHWKCSCGHTWFKEIRIQSKNNYCPKCKKNKNKKEPF